MADLLVDSDVFIDHLRGARRLEAPVEEAIYFSVITRCELFAGPQEQEERVCSLLSAFRELAVDSTIAELAGGLRRAVGVRTPDALIAATALSRGLTLLTRNVRDFEPIPSLVVRVP